MENLIEELIKQNQQQAEQNRQLIQQLIAMQQAPNNHVNALNSTDQKAKHLAEQMVCFTYDPDSNLTFDSWYDRYQSIFTTEVADWAESTKIRLLLQKFNQADYQKFADSTLPQKPTELAFDVVIQRLTTMFGYRETKFALRHKCFNLKKEDSEDFVQFAARINKNGEKFDIARCTSDDLKVLLFVSGLKCSQDSLILEKLLAKIDAVHIKLEAATTEEARAAIPKLTLQDLVNEAQRLISLKQDKTTVVESSSAVTSNIFSVKSHNGNNKWNSNKFHTTGTKHYGNSNGSTSASSSKPPSPCRYCGGDHWERECSFKDKECGQCTVIGHKNGFCASAHQALLRKKRFGRNQRRYSDPGTDQSIKQVKSASNAGAQRKFLSPSINGAKIRLQLDSGSDISIISRLLPSFWNSTHSNGSIPSTVKWKSRKVRRPFENWPREGRG